MNDTASCPGISAKACAFCEEEPNKSLVTIIKLNITQQREGEFVEICATTVETFKVHQARLEMFHKSHSFQLLKHPILT